MGIPSSTMTSPPDRMITESEVCTTHSRPLPAAPAAAPPPVTTTGRPAAVGPVAYIMSRFPKITETFVLYEILAVEQLGRPVEVYPLLRESTAVMHPEAEAVVQRAHFKPFMSWQVARSNWHYLKRKPMAYLKALGAVARGTWGSLNFFCGGLALYPKVVAFAHSMEKQGITHVHAHFCNHPAMAAFVIHRLTGIPYSFTAHGSDLHRDRHMLCDKVREAEFVATVSQYNRDLIIAECGQAVRDKVQVIHCGVDVNAFRPAPRGMGQDAITANGKAGDGALSASFQEQPASAGVRPLKIICVGTLHEVKGQAYLIEACGRLRQRGVNFECHLIGDGQDRDRLTTLATRLGVAESVHFHGACTRAEVIARLRESDVVVAPSVPTSDGRREGIPVALMEAMASGVAVVASRLSGIPELVEHEQSGLLTPPRDVEALAAALGQLAHDPELRQRLSSEARGVIERDFNLFENAQRLMQHFASAPSPTTGHQALRPLPQGGAR